MFSKVGDSPVLKVMTIKQGKEVDVKVAKCTKCGQTTDSCHCVEDLKAEEKDERKS